MLGFKPGLLPLEHIQISELLPSDMKAFLIKNPVRFLFSWMRLCDLEHARKGLPTRDSMDVARSALVSSFLQHPPV